MCIIAQFPQKPSTMTVQKITLSAEIPEKLLGKRLDVILSELFKDYSRGTLQTWIKQGAVTVGQTIIQKPSQKMTHLTCIQIQAELIEQTPWQAQNIQLNIIYEDEAMLIINKPAGLVTHPAPGSPDNTLVNALLHHCPSLNELPRAGIIHRLDKDTTGLMVVPKTLSTHHFLVDQLQQRLIARHYQALVYGTIISGGTVAERVGRHPTHRTKMAVTPDGKQAVTHYRVNKRFADFTLLDLKLETGRTHQIRVHMHFIGHPIVGDQTYGQRLHTPKNCEPELAEKLRQFKRQALHAIQLTLTHPITKESMSFAAPLPHDFQTLLASVKNNQEKL